jgi:hypothetical protein
LLFQERRKARSFELRDKEEKREKGAKAKRQRGIKRKGEKRIFQVFNFNPVY